MASRPRKNQAGTYFITWSNSKKKPRQKNESLRTKKLKEARQRASALEQLYENGYHDPYQISWHENEKIKGFVRSGVIDLQKLSKEEMNEISSIEAIARYIHHKKNSPDGWGEYTRKAEPKKLEQFIPYLPLVLKETTEDQILDNIKRDISDWHKKGLATVWNSFSRWAESQGYMKAVIIKVKKPKKSVPKFIYNDELEKACLSKLEQVESLITKGECSSDNNQAWMVLAWLVSRFTGVRPKELMSLKLDHYSNNQLIIGADFLTKTREERIIYIDNEQALAVFSLLSNPKFRTRDRYMANSDYLFGRKGETMKKRVASEFKDHSGRKFYDLRNTFAGWLLTEETSEGARQLYNIQQQMGHSDLKMTLRYLQALGKNVDRSVFQDLEFVDEVIERVKNILEF